MLDDYRASDIWSWEPDLAQVHRKPYLYSYKEIMRCKELDKDYKGKWME